MQLTPRLRRPAKLKPQRCAPKPPRTPPEEVVKRRLRRIAAAVRRLIAAEARRHPAGAVPLWFLRWAAISRLLRFPVDVAAAAEEAPKTSRASSGFDDEARPFHNRYRSGSSSRRDT